MHGHDLSEFYMGQVLLVSRCETSLATIEWHLDNCVALSEVCIVNYGTIPKMFLQTWKYCKC